MLDRLNKMVNKPDVPNLYIAERVVQQMATAAQQYLEDETGEAMIGLVVPPDDETDKTSVYVMDTIAPGADALRASHTFQQGAHGRMTCSTGCARTGNRRGSSAMTRTGTRRCITLETGTSSRVS